MDAKFAGFEIGPPVYTTALCTVHRAAHPATGERVYLKILAADVPSPSQVARIRHEYALLSRIQHDNVVRAHGVVREGARAALVVEDFGGRALSERSSPCLPLDQVVRVGIAVAEALGAVHRAHMIHKDVNPGNVVWDPERGTIKLIDFGIASELDREQASYRSTGALEGTLQYVAPEQTGRMNRLIDSRTDLYSLGATLFALATGRPPFPDTDPLDVLHGHLARRPPLLRSIIPLAPAALEAIIDRLLAKMADQRYRTAWGLASDLRRIASQLESGADEPFELGAEDVSDRFELPQRLYGRDADRDALLRAFDRAAAGERAWVLVAGYSGIGKSALVHEIHRPITERRGLFASGKFDQFQRDVPYAPILTAFRGLVAQLLSEAPERLAVVRARLAEALGPNGAVVADVIPEVELLLGPQPLVPELAPTEAMNRFLHVFEAFAGAFASETQPLVLFLDDLQWADLPSLQLLTRLQTESTIRHFLLVGAYRDNEVGEGHPFALAVERVGRAGNEPTRIVLAPLQEPDVQAWLADALLRPRADVAPLASRCFRQTGGNPFFLGQFLLALVERGGIRFDPATRRWTWDDDAIAGFGITANVVEFMAARIGTLGAEAQDSLVGAALLGAEFDLETLSIASGGDALTAAARIEPAVREGLVVPRGAAWQLLATMEGGASLSPDEPAAIRYAFLHDRVQQAAYAKISEAERAVRHLEIARRLVARLDDKAQVERIFDLVRHANEGRALMTDGAERRAWLERNLIAGRRAIAAAAFGPAVQYLVTAIELGGSDLWARDHALALDLYTLAAQAAYQSGDFHRMESIAVEVDRHARTPLQRARIGEVRVQAYIGQNRLVEAVDGALAVLATLGVTFPGDPQPADVMAAIGAAATAVGGRSAAELLAMEEMADPEKRAALRMLQKITSATYVARPALFPLVPMMGVTLSATHGMTGASTYAFACYGIILAGVVGDVPRAAEMGTFARQLVERFAAREYEARTRYIDACYIRHWCRHAFETWEAFPAIYEVGLETGDLEFAGWALMMGSFHALYGGRALAETDAEFERATAAIAQVKQETALQYARSGHQVIRALLGATVHPSSLDGPGFDAEAQLAHHIAAKDAFGVANHLFSRIVLLALHGRHAEARTLFAQLDPWFPSMVATIHVPSVMLFDAWTALSLARSSEGPARDGLIERARGARAQLAAFATHAPMNHSHKLALVDGLLAVQDGDPRAARRLLRASVAAAAAGENLWGEALALQELSQLWADEEGEPEVAERFARRAHQVWTLWGAGSLGEALILRYGAAADSRSWAITSSRSSSHVTVQTNRNQTVRARSDEFDFLAIVRANQALSAEVQLDGLLQALMRLALESGGAVYGALLLGDEKKARLTAVDSVGDTIAAKRLDQGVDEAIAAGRLPGSVYNYVLRTKSPLIVQDAARDARFARDNYVRENRTRSVLAQPIVHQGQWVGVVYLENSLASGAFTPDRAQAIALLCGQAAVAVQNASLFARQQTLVDAFARFVPKPFLQHLGRADVTDIQLGDSVRANVAILFSDLRDFTLMSEGLRPEENFSILNDYLARMVPEIEGRGGFVDKYVGDAIMALFPGDPDAAIDAAVGMHRALDRLNTERSARGDAPLSMGVGVHAGDVMLGTVGAGSRMDTTVIGDAVNLASRLEGLTKVYGTRVLVSTTAAAASGRPHTTRDVGVVRVRGKQEGVGVVEVLDAWPAREREARLSGLAAFDRARDLYFSGDHDAAQRLWRELVDANPDDGVVRYYHERSGSVRSGEAPLTSIAGVEVIDLK